jgi:hypothetical protein
MIKFMKYLMLHEMFNVEKIMYQSAIQKGTYFHEKIKILQIPKTSHMSAKFLPSIGTL